MKTVSAKKVLRKFLLLAALWAFCLSAAGAENIRIFSFNIQVFGRAKMANTDVASILAEIVQLSDLIAIQEVRSSSIEPIEHFMRLLPPRYSYIIGPREGRSSSKEQFWYIYDTHKLRVLAADTWTDEENIFERRPFAAFFQTRDKFDFIIINNHIQPSNAYREISALPRVAAYYQRIWNEKDVILAGDFNSDGSYFDENRLLEIFPPSEYSVIISNEYDTSVAAASNTYDRIIITLFAAEDYAERRGVLRFDELYNFEQYRLRPRDISDHYPIWAEFSIHNDTD